jgi:hypothetical protein
MAKIPAYSERPGGLQGDENAVISVTGAGTFRATINSIITFFLSAARVFAGKVTATQFESTVASPTAPMTVASTARVTNLYASTALRQEVSTYTGSANDFLSERVHHRFNTGSGNSNFPATANGLVEWVQRSGTGWTSGDFQVWKASSTGDANSIRYIRYVVTSSPLVFSAWYEIYTSANANTATVIWTMKHAQFGNYTTAQQDALTPAAGWQIYNITTNKMRVYNGTIWNDLY